MNEQMRAEAANEAAHHMARLWVCGAILDILGGSAGNSLDCGERIAKILKAEQQKLLKKYDREIARASK